jgi:hypothetical protein
MVVETTTLEELVIAYFENEDKPSWPYII